MKLEVTKSKAEFRPITVNLVIQTEAEYWAFLSLANQSTAEVLLNYESHFKNEAGLSSEKVAAAVRTPLYQFYEQLSEVR